LYETVNRFLAHENKCSFSQGLKLSKHDIDFGEKGPPTAMTFKFDMHCVFMF